MSALPVRRIAVWVLSILLALLFIMAGLGKLTGAAAEMFAGWGYPSWFMILIGVFEVAGALGLVIPRTSRYAVLGLTGIMLGAGYTHLANSEATAILRPLIFLAVLWVIWWLRSRPK